MATEVISTIRSSGGDYTSLSSWEAGEQKNLVTADEISTAECYNDWPSGLSDEVNITGWTTDSTRYCKITVAFGHRHDGTPQSGFYIKKGTTGSSLLLNQQTGSVFEWLDGEQTTASSRKYCFRTFGAGARFINCIGKNAGTDQAAFATNVTGLVLRCCLAYSSWTGFENSSGTVAQNCVAANCTRGFGGSGGNGVATNCVAYSNTTNWYSGWGASGFGSNNATSSASDDAPGGSSVWNVASSDFANAAGNDFHLASGSALIGAGANLYSTFTTDIDGDTWPSSGAWDIGFDYYVASSSLPTLTNITLSNITTSGYRATVAGS